MLPPFFRTASLFNPIVYLVGGFRHCFYGIADVSFAASLGTTLAFFAMEPVPQSAEYLRTSQLARRY
jgi:ABC-2 type transport system permease protein